MILTRSFYYLVSVLSLTAAQTPSSTCTAKVSVDSSAPGHAAFMYTDIYVENTGSCPITKVITSITLPPMEQAFDYKNVSGETGELFGISFPLLPSNTELGGTIVLRSARLPMVELGSVECEASCMGSTESTSTRSVRTSPPMPTTTKVEIEWGSNPRWLALSLIDDVDTSEVWIVDSKNSRQLMKRENWDIKTAYTFSPNVNPLELPLSVELKSNNGEVIVLKDLITSFSYAVIDTQAAFSSTPLTPTDYSLRLVSHPSSNSHWIGLAMYGTQTDKVTSISVKASNTDYAPMELTSVGFFSISSPNLALRTPISARITFEDGHVLDMDNVVMF